MIAIVSVPKGKIRELVLQIIASKENQSAETGETYDKEMELQNRICPVCGKRWGDHSPQKMKEHGQTY